MLVTPYGNRMEHCMRYLCVTFGSSTPDIENVYHGIAFQRTAKPAMINA